MAEKHTREILKYYGQKVDAAINKISAFSMIHRDAV